jgi:2-hydroxychromene-2-carboxylate isomerase
MNKITFCYDIVCPYARLATTQVEALAQRCQAQLEFKPILLGGLYKLDNAAQGASGSATDIMSDRRRAYNLMDLTRQASRFNVEVKMPNNHPQKTLATQRILASVEDETLRRKVTHRLYDYYWKEQGDMTSLEKLQTVLKPFQIDVQVAETEAAKTKLHNNTSWAYQKGAFGVPTYVVEQPSSDEETIYFGGDRSHFVEQFFNKNHQSYPNEFRVTKGVPSKDISEKKKIAYYFDFSSPWTYLAHKQLYRLHDYGEVERIPVLLGAIFRQVGNAMIPIETFSANKRAYYMRDFLENAEYHKIPVRYTDHFPLRTVQALRIACLEPQVIDIFFQAAWLENQNLGDENVLRSLLIKHFPQLNADELLIRSKSNEAKDQLLQNTEQAIKSNVFGCPTFIVDDHLFFGQDRIPMLQDYLSGWKPPI